MNTGSFLARMGLMTFGLVVWAAHFTVIYGVAALVCANRLDADGPFGYGTVVATTTAATALGILLVAGSMALAGRHLRDHAQPAHFMNVATLTVGALSILAIAWNALPSYLTPYCQTL